MKNICRMLALLLFFSMIFQTSISCVDAKTKNRNCWSKNGLCFYNKKGKKISGITVICEKKRNGTQSNLFYVFGKNKKLNAEKTIAVRKIAKYEKDFAKLKKIIGPPVSSKYKSGGCYHGPVRNGKTPYSGGKDGTLKYKTFRIFTYKAPSGEEFFMNAEGVDYKTNRISKRHCASLGKKAKKEGRKKRIIIEKNGKKYCYDGNGRQYAGWQRSGSHFYYFRIADGLNGYMVTGKKVNGIKLDSAGRAVIRKKNRRQIKNLMFASRIVDKATRLEMSRSKRLKKVWKYFISDRHFRYRGSPAFMKTRHWARDNAYLMFTRHHGACYEMGAAFAYLASACGYSDSKAVSSGGHGWAEVGGRVCDPSWQKVNPHKRFFMIKMSRSGKNGYPAYKNSRVYVRKI